MGADRGVAPRVEERWTTRHRVALWVSLAFVVGGFAYVVLWMPVVHGRSDIWIAPGDLWGTYLGAQAVGHGHLGGLYTQQTGLVSFPGFEYLLAPVAVLGSGLGLSVGPPLAAFSTPSAWLVAGPVVLALSCVVLFAVDDLGRHRGLSPGRRLAMVGASAALMAPVVVRWGHPEDCVALGLVLYAALAADRGSWRAAGWLLGVAVCIQPLALLGVAPVLARYPASRLVRLVVPVVLPSTLVLVGPLLADWHPVVHAVVVQPNFPSFNHATPWTAVAPTTTFFHFQAVAAGPARLAASVAGVVLGAVVGRRRHDVPTVLLLIAVALLLRMAAESVIDAFYPWPVLALAVVLAGLSGPRRLAVVTGAGLVTTWWAQRSGPGVWPWWLVLMALLVGTLGLAVLPRARARLEPGPTPAPAPLPR
jgi:hypothetical protein